MNALQHIQKNLKVPKSQYNDFGGYHFRSAEDIVEAVKPLLSEVNAELIISDSLVELAGSVFVKATATLTQYNSRNVSTENGHHIWQADGFAKHDTEVKGMKAAQITGSASSFARKYALNGLFLIDDVKDADSTNTHGKSDEKKKDLLPKTADLPWLNVGTQEYKTAVDNKTPIEDLRKQFRISKSTEAKLTNDAKKQ